jgi:hypothetical protein
MARPKPPKKNTDVTQVVSTSAQSPLSDPVESQVERLAASLASEVTNTKPAKPMRKPEIVRGEPRANLVPINLDDEIRRLAYLLSEQRGFEPGHETEDWLNAEREVLGRYQQQRA